MRSLDAKPIYFSYLTSTRHIHFLPNSHQRTAHSTTKTTTFRMKCQRSIISKNHRHSCNLQTSSLIIEPQRRHVDEELLTITRFHAKIIDTMPVDKEDSMAPDVKPLLRLNLFSSVPEVGRKMEWVKKTLERDILRAVRSWRRVNQPRTIPHNQRSPTAMSLFLSTMNVGHIDISLDVVQRRDHPSASNVLSNHQQPKVG